MLAFFVWLKSLFIKQAPAPTAVQVPPPMSQPSAKPAASIGIDISHYDAGRADWTKLKNSIGFVFMKATQGLTFIDPTFSNSWARAKALGIPRGAYHVLVASQDPIAQAEFFIRIMGALDADDLQPVLDWEQSVNNGGGDSASCLAFLAHVEKLSGKTPLLYGSSSAIREMKFPAEATRYPLWIANYGVTKPSIPAPWTSWLYWQFTESGSVDGIGNCDVNYKNS